MTLQAIFDVTTGRLRAQLGFEGTDCQLGGEWSASEGSPPRVVWVPSEDAFDGDPKGGTNPSAIYEAAEGFNVHLWGADFDPTRELRSAFLRALHRNAKGSCRIHRGLWVPANAGLVREGRLYLLSIAVLVPVTRDPLPTGTPGGVRINPQVSAP